MNVNWLISDVNQAESIHRQNEIRRQMQLARAHRIERASKPHRGLFAGRRARRRRR